MTSIDKVGSKRKWEDPFVFNSRKRIDITGYSYEIGTDTEDELEFEDEAREKAENAKTPEEREAREAAVAAAGALDPDYFWCYERETDDAYSTLVTLKDEIENMTDITDLSDYVRWTTAAMNSLLSCTVIPQSYYESWNNDLKPYFQQGKLVRAASK